MYNIFAAFDANPPLEVSGIFLIYPKHLTKFRGLLHKLKNNGIGGNPLSLIESNIKGLLLIVNPPQ